jgi:two-component system CheB/CheR fusion protein
MEGPTMVLNAKAAQNFALAIHELATNAVKYGALSNQSGRVHISWTAGKPNGHQQFMFKWQEYGGPQVSPPSRKGFGTTVLEQVMAEYFDTLPQMKFAADGVRYEVATPVPRLSRLPVATANDQRTTRSWLVAR